MSEDGLFEQINERLGLIAQVQAGIPLQIEELRKDATNIAREAATLAIQKHEAECTARKNIGAVSDRVADATGQITVLRETGRVRRSLAPAARAVGLDRVPTYVWRALAIIGIGVAGKFGIDGVALLTKLNF